MLLTYKGIVWNIENNSKWFSFLQSTEIAVTNDWHTPDQYEYVKFPTYVALRFLSAFTPIAIWHVRQFDISNHMHAKEEQFFAFRSRCFGYKHIS